MLSYNVYPIIILIMSDELMEKVILKEEMPRYELFILKKRLEELKAEMDACTTSCNSKRAL